MTIHLRLKIYLNKIFVFYKISFLFHYILREFYFSLISPLNLRNAIENGKNTQDIFHQQ